MHEPQALTVIPGTQPNRNVVEIASATIESVPTVIGRIVLMAAMLDRNNRQYVHPLNLPNLREASANRLMADTHLRLVIAWLDNPLENRVNDMKEFLSSFGPEGSDLGWVIRRLGKYEDLMPVRIPAMVREHFLREMELSLRLAFAQCSAPAAVPRYAQPPDDGPLSAWLEHCWI